MKTRRYETLLLLDSELPQEEQDQVKEKLITIIEKMDGRLIQAEDWGRKRLAYPVKKQLYGQYHLLDYMGTPELLAEVDRNMGIDERIFKNMTIILDKDFTTEKYDRELERLRTEEAKREAEKAAREAERAAREAEAAARAEEAAKAEAAKAEAEKAADEPVEAAPEAAPEEAPEASREEESAE